MIWATYLISKATWVINRVPFTHEVHTVLLDRTESAYSVVVQPPGEWLKTVEIPAEKINVNVETNGIPNFEAYIDIIQIL